MRLPRPLARAAKRFISGAASLVLAVMCLFSLDNALTLLAIWIGIGFIFRGVATTGTAVSDKAMPGRGWAIFFGIITVLAGMVMLASPFGTIALLTLVVGWWLIVLGAFEIGAALSLRKEASKSPV